MPDSHTTSVRVYCSVFSVLFFAAACTKSGKPITGVDVVERSGLLDKKKIEEHALKTAGGFKGFSVRKAKPDENAHQLGVRIFVAGERPAVAEDGGAPIEGQMARAVMVQMTLSPLKGLERYEGDAQVQKNVPASSSYETLVFEALDEAARSLSGAIELADADDAKVLKAIMGEDRGLQKRAVVMAGERKLKAALPKLSEIVRDEKIDDQDLVLKAIGALVQIGDPSAVSALIDAGRRRTSAYLSQILFAVAQLGGKEAEAYLFTVSNGHADPEIRKNASAALEELEQRRDKAAKPE